MTRDPDDDYFAALARLHDAEVIVSGDRDLYEWKEQSPPVHRSTGPPVVLTVVFEGMLANTR